MLLSNLSASARNTIAKRDTFTTKARLIPVNSTDCRDNRGTVNIIPGNRYPPIILIHPSLPGFYPSPARLPGL
jgi:hypothetical protein